MNQENNTEAASAQSKNKGCAMAALFFTAITAAIIVVLYLLKIVLLPE
jgi:hypothetical protein